MTWIKQQPSDKLQWIKLLVTVFLSLREIRFNQLRILPIKLLETYISEEDYCNFCDEIHLEWNSMIGSGSKMQFETFAEFTKNHVLSMLISSLISVECYKKKSD